MMNMGAKNKSIRDRLSRNNSSSTFFEMAKILIIILLLPSRKHLQ
ncbi:hypothetical protein SMU9_00055 [Streptococcus mutans 1ID3]|nr:hypothetical protein SMU9_00055 [Streptococcus mutans 1ID3]